MKNRWAKTYIKPLPLIKMYKLMKNEPLKLWLIRDFQIRGAGNRKHMNVLIRMGLVEQYRGWVQGKNQNVTGYKLILRGLTQ